MPPKKATKLKEKPQADPDIDPNAIPPALPPSVEEAYRRKCIQLKQRTNEVEEENDATRVRLSRIRRQIEKMRVERAFLLEQLSRRTSANVEDSEGSPSPPPTPQEKPLRTKRGHRKPSILADADAASAANKSNAASPLPPSGLNQGAASPSSEAFSQSQDAAASAARRKAATNGLPKPPKKPLDAFELYCEEARSVLLKTRDEKGGEDELTVDEELAKAWKDLPDREKEPFQTRYEEELAKYEREREEYEAAEAAAKKDKGVEAEGASSPTKATGDKSAEEQAKEDAEMKDDDGDEVGADSGSKAAAAQPETQDEDVEMRDDETEQADDAPPEDKADDAKSDSKGDD